MKGLLLFVVLSQIPAASNAPLRNPNDKLMYVWVPPGTFRMGCSDGDKECYEDEKPAHTVQLTNGFWMGQTEVTVAAFTSFTSKYGKAIPPGQKGSKYPITGVIWAEADAYCKWAGGRLPSEAEWEYAARGGTFGIRYGELDSIAWTSANSGNTVHEAAKKKPNAYGLFDMLGNMWEWTADWYGARYYEQSPAVDPKGPPTGDTLVDKAKGANGDVPTRTLRGGGWRGFPGVARASYRYWFVPTLRVANIGFRCVIDKLP